jgi:ubiquinone/menaquinone biosynthesis C-methylase UbiE
MNRSKPVETIYGPEAADLYDSLRFASVGGRKIHEIEFGHLRSTLQLVSRDATILEVGCGTGRLMCELHEAGYYPDGLDASLPMLKHCQKRLQPLPGRPRLFLGEAAYLPLSSDLYDLVYSIRVLNQTRSRDYALKAIAEMIRVAKPDGLVLVEFMNRGRSLLDERRVYFGPSSTVERSSKVNIRLRSEDVKNVAVKSGAIPVWTRGAFLFGMTALNMAPDGIVGPLSGVDQWLSQFVPGLTSRCYMLLRKVA